MSGMTLVTAPSVEPVTLAEVRAHCRVTSNDEDALLAGYLIAARQHVEDYTGRALMTQTWDVFFDGDWPLVWDKSRAYYTQRIVLPKAPVQSVTVSYVDANGATQTLAGSEYQAVTTAAVAYIVPSYAAVWPTVRDQQNAVTVRIVAGYGSNPGDAPEPIRLAILLLVGHWFEHREAVNIGNSVSEVPLTVCSLLSPYRAEFF